MTTAAGLTLSAGGASLLVLSAALSLAEGRRARILPGSIGLLSPNAVALALTEHPSVAGSAFALLGVSQYVIRGASTPLVGIAGSRTALPVTLTIAARSAAAVACYLLSPGCAGAELRHRNGRLKSLQGGHRVARTPDHPVPCASRLCRTVGTSPAPCQPTG